MEPKQNQPRPNCPFCTRPCKVYSNTHIAKTCTSKDCVRKLKESTNLARGGHISNLHRSDVKPVILENLKERYGEEITNVSQIPAVKSQKASTCRKNFGVDWPMQSEIIREKSRATLESLYGVENIFQAKNIVARIQDKLNRIDPATGKTVRALGLEKGWRNNLKKYGFRYYFQSKKFRKQYIEWCLKNYEVDNFWKSDKFYEMMVERGIRYSSDDERNKYIIYQNKVYGITRRIFTRYFDIISMSYLHGPEFHIDHIYSVAEGYRQDIQPEIIGSLINLQMLPAKINIQKQDDCWMTKEELIDRYKKWAIEQTGVGGLTGDIGLR